MLHGTVPVLFESSDDHAVVQDPVNKDWVALLESVDEERFGTGVRRYYLALSHFRRQRTRSALPGQLEIVAVGKQQAQQEMLAVWEQRKASRQLSEGEQGADVLVNAAPPNVDDLPEALRDFTKSPPPLRDILSGGGRPPAMRYAYCRRSWQRRCSGSVTLPRRCTGCCVAIPPLRVAAAFWDVGHGSRRGSRPRADCPAERSARNSVK